MPRALISVSDKRGIVEFARGLRDLGWDLLSTGGTAAALRKADLPVVTVEEVTHFPEILDGRVKTLHPAIHAGLLARPGLEPHASTMAEHGFDYIHLVAVNLYPFRATVANPSVSLEDAMENVDIGGPSMLRSAAKNHEHVLPVVDPMDYPRVLWMLRAGDVPGPMRRELAAKVFTHTADYDSAISNFLTSPDKDLPARINLSIERRQTLRYGENPGQRAALYVTEEPRGFGDLRQLQGKGFSFNNLLDIDGAIQAVGAWKHQPACAVIKHTTPCGIATGRNALEAVTRARATDPLSAFGSVIALNTVVDAAVAESLQDLFVEVIVAPAFTTEARAVFASKKNLRVVELPVAPPAGDFDWKRVRGGFLVQERFQHDPSEVKWTVATARRPTEAEWSDLRFAWAAVASVKSNAILLARNEMAIGIGAGQMSRVDAAFLAIHKARLAGHAIAGCALASDAFFPFADGVEEAAAAGVAAIIQPGGSVRDAEVIGVANKHGLAMVLTGQRQFRH